MLSCEDTCAVPVVCQVLQSPPQSLVTFLHLVPSAQGMLLVLPLQVEVQTGYQGQDSPRGAQQKALRGTRGEAICADTWLTVPLIHRRMAGICDITALLQRDWDLGLQQGWGSMGNGSIFCLFWL